MLRLVLCALVLGWQPAAGGHGIRGIIYFTNNSQPDEAITVELLTRDGKRTLASKRPREMSFRFGGLRPARYVLRLRWRGCVLNYEVDARGKKTTSVRVIMDAACANERYGPDEVRPQPPPAPE